MLSTFLIVSPGEMKETVFRYRLPSTVLQQTEERWHYRLHIQKQAGREDIPVAVRVRLPAAAHIIETVPDRVGQQKQAVRWNVGLSTDQSLMLTFAAEDALSARQSQGTTP
jgi:hypothetical protein